MYSFQQSLIPLSSTITFPDAPFIQFYPVISCLSLTICFALQKISFWHSESFKSFARSFCFFSFVVVVVAILLINLRSMHLMCLWLAEARKYLRKFKETVPRLLKLIKLESMCFLLIIHMYSKKADVWIPEVDWKNRNYVSYIDENFKTFFASYMLLIRYGLECMRSRWSNSSMHGCGARDLA